MSVITGINNGSLKELMAAELVNLKVQQDYLTSKLDGGSAMTVLVANNRGFRFALDYTRNNSVGYMDPAGGALTATMQPALDNMTANLQYMQFGQELTNLQLANSRSGVHVGPAAKALAATKILEREAEMEEHYFCRGDGLQTIAVITTPASGAIANVGSTNAVTCTGTTDGLGAYLLGNNQVVRIFNSTGATWKATGTISAKTSNTAFTFTATAIASQGVTAWAAGDLVFPDGLSVDTATNAIASVGVKGLPYLIKSSGSYFDKSLSTVTALQGVIDSSTSTISRTTIEALYRNSQIRCGKKLNQRAVCSFAQMSNYYVQFFGGSGFSAQAHLVGSERLGIDLSGSKGTPNDYTQWGQPIDAYAFINPKNWWNLDYSTFCRLTLKDIGVMMTMPNEYQLKVSGGVYNNSQVSWDDNYLEYLSDQPFKNSGFTALSFSALPGLLVNSPFTGS